MHREQAFVWIATIIVALMVVTAANIQLYSITSSARCWRNQGTSRPSALAVLRLITNSNLVGCTTGTLEYPVGVDADLPVRIGDVGPVVAGPQHGGGPALHHAIRRPPHAAPHRRRRAGRASPSDYAAAGTLDHRGSASGAAPPRSRLPSSRREMVSDMVHSLWPALVRPAAKLDRRLSHGPSPSRARMARPMMRSLSASERNGSSSVKWVMR